MALSRRPRQEYERLSFVRPYENENYEMEKELERSWRKKIGERAGEYRDRKRKRTRDFLSLSLSLTLLTPL